MHLSTVRFGGHAGSDAEAGYRTPAEIAAEFGRDPLLGTASALITAGLLTAGEVLDRYEQSRKLVSSLAEQAETEPRLTHAHQVMAPLAPRHPELVAGSLRRPACAAGCGSLTASRQRKRAC